MQQPSLIRLIHLTHNVNTFDSPDLWIVSQKIFKFDHINFLYLKKTIFREALCSLNNKTIISSQTNEIFLDGLAAVWGQVVQVWW